nr:hypothetical protein [uncultured bacterium]
MAWRRVKITAKTNSFQLKMKVKMVAVISPGVDTGKTILKKVLKSEAPSTLAASSRSPGI